MILSGAGPSFVSSGTTRFLYSLTIPTIASPPIQEAAEASHSPVVGSGANSGTQSPSLLFMSSETQNSTSIEHATDATSMHIEP